MCAPQTSPRPRRRYAELLPFLAADEKGNVDQRLVDRVDEEVRELMGVSLDELLNPSKVVNLERDRIVTLQALDERVLDGKALDAESRGELEAKLDKIETDLYREKRTVFRGWLKGVFVAQALIAICVSGYFVFDTQIDLSLRALGFWSYWLFIIPSLRARRPTGWEKRALNYAFLGSPALTLGMPFLIKQPAAIWGANLLLLAGCYGYAYLGPAEEESAGGFSGVLRWLDFGSGQERGMRASQREKLAAKEAEEGGAPPQQQMPNPFDGLKLPELPKDFKLPNPFEEQ